MNIYPVNTAKTVEYQNNLQVRFKEVGSSKDKHNNMFSGSLGDSPAVKVDISGVGLEMSEHNGKMPEGAIEKLQRTPLTKEQLKGVPNARSGEEILTKMKETDPDSYKEYESLRKEDTREIARFISKWAMRDALPQLSCWELMDRKNKDY
jgi:hypothetical protein